MHHNVPNVGHENISLITIYFLIPAILYFQLVRTIFAEYGTADSGLLERKLKEMRILENVDLPTTFADLLVKPKESFIDLPSEDIESSEEVEPSDEEPSDEEDSSEGKDLQNRVELPPEPAPEPLKMVRMANLSVVGGHAVNGVAEIHSKIVKDEVFNAFYQVSM